jgi:MoaA/NifB/PqqE/SkfB family radical SAM enzyme
MGRMSDETFAAILAGLKQLDPIPNVYFGGIGEPLFHPRTVEWIRQIKALGVKVEVITNGTILTEKKSRELIEAGLDVLWVSLDGGTPEGYEDVRLGAELPKVIENVKRFAMMRKGNHHPTPEIGVAFVAMKRNIHELPMVINIGKALGAKHFSVSNVQPATAEMQEDRLYQKTLHNIAYLPSKMLPYISLPKMDFNDLTSESLFNVFNSGCNVSFAGNNWGGANDVCNFIESGTVTIAWNGDASPCWPLMHNHTSFLHGKPRNVHKHVIGNVREKSVGELWLDPAYVEYRSKVQRFAFAPCTFCGGCEMSEANQEDCFGNEAPACGGCLWAQGVIQCP